MNKKRIQQALNAADRFPLIQVIWLDHTSYDNWTTIERMKDKFEAVVVITTGHLVHEDDENVFVSLNIGEEDSASCTMTIMKCAIIKRRKLCTT